MNVQNFSFNPFALSTAKNAWQDEQTSSLTKVFKTAGGAIYDLYAKNPYDLTFGNCNALVNSEEPQSLKTKIGVSATVAFGSLYTLMLYGTTVHLYGRCLLVLGSNFVKAGEAVQKLGTNLFVAGALPLYSIFYALPNHVFRSLPQIVDVVTAKISLVADWTFKNMLQPLWAYVISPAAQVAAKMLDFAATKIGAALEVVEKTVSAYAQKVFETVIIPFWENTLFPLLHQLGNVIHKMRVSLDPLLNFLTDVQEKTAHAVKWTFQNFITPTWNHFVLPTAKIAGRTLQFAAKIASEILSEAFHVTAKTASFLYQNVLVPAFREIPQYVQAAGIFLDQYVVKPLIPLLANAAEKAGQVFIAIFNSVIVPAANVVADKAILLKDSVLEFNNEMLRTIHSIWGRVAWA